MRLEIDVRIRRRLEAAFAVECDSLGIVGPSGSGKSTLLDAVAGIEPGRVVLDGEDVSRVPLHLREFGYVSQEALLFPHLSVRENLRYSPRSGPMEAAVDALGIGHLLDRRPRTLSGGERRRVALARAILSRPRLLLLNEPFAGLDEPRRRDAMSLLDGARRRFRIPMILVSHLAAEVVGLTDRSVRLEEGRVVAEGPSAAVLRSGETQIDNYFVGTVVAPGRVRVGGIELAAAVHGSGEVRLACYAHDILLAAEVPRAISARNCFPTTVAAVEPAGDTVLVTLSQPPLRALVTADAARELDLRRGAPTVAVIKAMSIAHMGAA